MVEESIEVIREVIKLIKKVLLKLEYYIVISFSISNRSYSRRNNQLGGTRQRNCLSEANYRDIFHLIFR